MDKKVRYIYRGMLGSLNMFWGYNSIEEFAKFMQFDIFLMGVGVENESKIRKHS
jgi:hypothetical protein